VEQKHVQGTAFFLLLHRKTKDQLYWAIAVATLNSCINGYDGSLMGSINSYRQYREYFGFDPEAGTPSTGIVYAIYTIGNLVGSFCAGPFTDFRGNLPRLFHQLMSR
jgi:MFS family permease